MQNTIIGTTKGGSKKGLSITMFDKIIFPSRHYNKAKVDLELSGDKNLLMRNDGKAYTVLAEFTDTSDLANFNKGEDIRVVVDL